MSMFRKGHKFEVSNRHLEKQSFERLAGRKNETSSQEDFEDMRVD